MELRIRQRTTCISGCILYLLSGVARSAADPAAEPALKSGLSAAQDPVSMSSLWQLTLGMLLVLGLILGIAWLLKRTGRFQMAAGGGLRILGGLSMGARERVVLLQVGETQLLVGVAPGRVQTLHVLDEPLAERRNSPAQIPGFADQLGRFLKRDRAS
jgi:flagellar protein FliO/FliZ